MKKNLFFFAFICLTSFANAQWQQTSLDSVWANCITINGNNIFVGTGHNMVGDGVFLSSDNGNSWVALNNGLTSSDVNALAFKGDTLFAGTWGVYGLYLSSNNGQLWSPSGFAAEEVNALTISGNNIYAGTLQSVYLSSNNGSSWSAVHNGISINNPYVVALATKGDSVFAGCWCNGVFCSANNGSNWTLMNDLTSQCADAFAINGNNIFAGTFTGVYLSSNNGSSWDAVNTGLTMPNVRSLVVNNNYIFAGTNGGGVFLSLNNGNSWDAVNTGLTNLVVYSLAISGNTLFAGTDSGGVWKRALSEMTEIKDINNNENNILVYPNPTNDKLTIETLQKSTIEISNMQGQTIHRQQIQQGKTDIDISGFVKGVYILRLISNDKIGVTKFIKE